MQDRRVRFTELLLSIDEAAMIHVFDNLVTSLGIHRSDEAIYKRTCLQG